MKNNLETYSVLYIIKCCLLALSSIFIWLNFAFVSFLFSGNNSFNYQIQSNGELPFSIETIIKYIVGIGTALGILFILFVIGNFLTAYYLKKQKNYYFTVVIAVLSCFTGVLGILLGVFTLIEITKPEVKALFFNKNTTTNDFSGIIQQKN